MFLLSFNVSLLFSSTSPLGVTQNREASGPREESLRDYKPDRSSHPAWRELSAPLLKCCLESAKHRDFPLGFQLFLKSQQLLGLEAEWSPASGILVLHSASLPTQLSDTAISIGLGYPQTISPLPGSCGCLPALDCRELCFTHTAITRTGRSDSSLLHACLVSTSQRTLQFLFPVGGRQLPRQPVALGQAALVATVYLSDIGNAFTLLFPS